MTKKLVPEVKQALNRFKIESSKDMELDLNNMDNAYIFSNKLKGNVNKFFNPKKF